MQKVLGKKTTRSRFSRRIRHINRDVSSGQWKQINEKKKIKWNKKNLREFLIVLICLHYLPKKMFLSTGPFYDHVHPINLFFG